MPSLDEESLRREVLADLEALRNLEGYAVRRNRGLRAERMFWMAMLLDIAEVAVPCTLLGRIGLRLIRRVAARERERGDLLTPEAGRETAAPVRRW